MFSQVFLAVTGKETETARPERTAYMACHFSPGGVGLSNTPGSLPPGSILLLDDSMPVQGHNPESVVAQLNELVERFSVWAVLLDFQRPPTEEAKAMSAAILRGCCCTVATTPAYVINGFPVFLPPPPVNKSLKEYLKPWDKVFLELATEGLEITVTKDGRQFSSAYPTAPLPLQDDRLHCHYGVTVSPGKAVFTLNRTREDLAALAHEAKILGILGLVGLYQELK